MLHFRSLLAHSLPVSLAGVTPDALAQQSVTQIENTLAWQGNRQVPMAELFEIGGDASDLAWQLEGDFSAVRHVAGGMRKGSVRLTGDVGHHAGQAMRGGTLTIEGNAGDWLGTEMRGGRIEVTGNVGDHAGGALVASKVGMRGGQILVRGHSGTHAAERMRRGCVTILGNCGEWAGHQMRAGTLMILGNCGPRPGAAMRRGTIALLGGAPELLPTFRYACNYMPQALGILLAELRRQGIDAPTPSSVSLYNGDLLEGGRGEVMVAQA